MFKKTIAKAAIGALAISGVATQAVSLKQFNPYAGLQFSAQLATPNAQADSTPEAAWKDLLPSSWADFSNGAFTVGAAIDPSLTFNVPVSVESVTANFAKSHTDTNMSNVAPKSKDEKMSETAEKIKKAASEVKLTDTIFQGIQAKFHGALAESLDVTAGVGAGVFFTQTENLIPAFTSHLGAEYHLTDNWYIPVNVQYYGKPLAKSENSINHWTFNIGAHYHF